MQHSKSLIAALLPFFISVSNVSADVSFTSTSTSAEVNTVAGSDSQIGIQQPPSDSGTIENIAFANVMQNNQGDGAGQATGTARVTPIDSKKLSATLQATTGILPGGGQANSTAAVTFFFNFPGRVVVDVQIKQGTTFIFIDGTQRDLLTEYELPQGQHKLEVRAQADSVVGNPNFGIFADIIEDSVTPTPTAGPDDPPSGNGPGPKITALITSIGSVKPAKTKAAKAALATLISQIKASEKSLRQELIAANPAVTGKVTLVKLTNAVKTAVAGLKTKSTADELKASKKASVSALKKLQKALGL